MRRIQLAELRDAWPAWLGVCIGFIVINFSLALCALAALAGTQAIRSGLLIAEQSAALVFTPVQNLVFAAIIGGTVIATATSLVVDSRRGSLARLALNGATPSQVVSTILVQLMVVSAVCALIGDVLAIAALEPTLVFLTDEREENIPVPPAIYAAWPIIAANVLAIGVAVIGGWRQARRASLIPPVEALRVAATGAEDAMTKRRWRWAVFVFAVVVATFAAIPLLTATPDKETISNLFILSTVVLILMALLLTLIAPAMVGPITRAWTKLVPTFDPSWDLARTTAVVKATRLTKSVVPVMMAVGLTFGMVAFGDSFMGTISANGYGDERLSSAGPATVVLFLAVPLAIALAGGVGSLIMMSKQREAELALSGIFGTTPAQRVGMPVMEAAIITVTGAILGLVMMGTSVAFMGVGFPAAGYKFAYTPSWLSFGLAFGISLAITAAATLLPTLRSLRLPEPRVIARLVAE